MRERYFLEYATELSAAQLRAIGLVAVRGSELEDAIRSMTAELLQMPTLLDAVLTHQSSGTLLQMMLSSASAYGYYANQPRMDELGRVVATTQAALGERNRIVHALWARKERARPGSTVRITNNARGKLTYTVEELTAKDIEAIAARVREATELLVSFFEKNPVPR